MKRLFYFVVLIVLYCLGCNKENKIIEDVNYDYFPLIAGAERIYKVTEINIDKAINLYDTVNYLLKENVFEEFVDNSGNKAWTVERYIKNDTMISWEIKDLWVAQLNDNQAQQVEENLRIVKIVFPLKKFKTWNGNIFNFLDPKYYEISSFDQTEIVNEINYSSVLTVLEEESESYIHKNYEVEQYAKNIGLINRTEISIVDKSTVIDIFKPIEQRISVGRLYYQTLISHN